MYLRSILLFILGGLTLLVRAQDDSCIVLMVAPMEQSGNIPQSVDNQLQTRLMNAVTTAGMVTGKDFGRFFVSGRFSHSYTEIVPGPPVQTIVHTALTLYIGDAKNKEVYASESFDLRGVGRSEERALLNALGQIKASNQAFISFVNRGKDRIIAYFDENYSQYLDSAKYALHQGDKDKALYFATIIPTGSKGHAEAQKVVEKICKKYDTPMTTAKSAGRQWNRQQQRPRPVIDFIQYK